MRKSIMTYILLGLILSVGVVISCTKKPKRIDTKEKPKTQRTFDQNPYTDMRKMALTVKAEQLGFQFSKDSVKIYGIVSDLNVSNGTATIATYLTGDASIYLSSGGGFVGAGQHESVQEVTKEFVNNGHLISSKGEPYDNTDLPTNGLANFYFLSNMGNTKITESITKMESGESKFSKLFADLNNVIAEIRLKSEN